MLFLFVFQPAVMLAMWTDLRLTFSFRNYHNIYAGLFDVVVVGSLSFRPGMALQEELTPVYVLDCYSFSNRCSFHG